MDSAFVALKTNRRELHLTQLLVSVEQVLEFELGPVHLVVVLVAGDHPVALPSLEVILDHDVQVCCWLKTGSFCAKYLPVLCGVGSVKYKSAFQVAKFNVLVLVGFVISNYIANLTSFAIDGRNLHNWVKKSVV